MRDELADKIRTAYSSFYWENSNYEKLKSSPLTQSNIVVSTTCADKTYKYGIVENTYNSMTKQTHLKYLAEFVDWDGMRYEYVDRAEEKAHLDKVWQEIQDSGKDEKEDDGSPKNPAIGMTAEQVRNSTWGSPNNINKTTTAYGVREQWVYSGNRYVYLDDGIVTAIQE